MEILYKPVSEFIGWKKAENFIQKIILENNYKSILEIGGGGNPTINSAFVAENNLDYTLSDIDEEELNKADDIYKKVVLDLSDSSLTHNKKYDLIFSRMVGEHISDGFIFHSNIYALLNPGGMSFHCFSTLYSIPFLLNKYMSDEISEKLLTIFAPREKHKHGKFKAYYSWCYGPTPKIVSSLESIGYGIEEYCGYFGHYYYKKIFFLHFLEKLKTQLLLKFSIPYFTSYSHIILKKEMATY